MQDGHSCFVWHVEKEGHCKWRRQEFCPFGIYTNSPERSHTLNKLHSKLFFLGFWHNIARPESKTRVSKIRENMVFKWTSSLYLIQIQGVFLCALFNDTLDYSDYLTSVKKRMSIEHCCNDSGNEQRKYL